MSPSHNTLQTLFNNFPVNELSTEEQRATFQKIKQRLETSPDVREELKTLYKVQNFSELATSLLWVVEKAERNLSEAPSPEDETLVLAAFRSAMGEMGSLSEAEPMSEPASFVGFGEPEQTPPMDEAVRASAEEVATGDEKAFAALLEQFVEATQSGDDSRTSLLERVRAECTAVDSGEFADDYKEYCRLLREFLTYISDNQFLDDVRVMNILSNVSSPVSQWANTPPEGRAGLLEEGIAPLRDFRSLFE
jgi:hypothetical protein